MLLIKETPSSSLCVVHGPSERALDVCEKGKFLNSNPHLLIPNPVCATQECAPNHCPWRHKINGCRGNNEDERVWEWNIFSLIFSSWTPPCTLRLRLRSMYFLPQFTPLSHQRVVPFTAPTATVITLSLQFSLPSSTLFGERLMYLSIPSLAQCLQYNKC